MPKFHKPPVRIKPSTQTELGITIPMLKSHKMAEDIALLREKWDDLQNKIDLRKEELQKQMKVDEVERIVAKTPGGSLYYFEIQKGEEKLKISKPAAA